MNMITDFYRKEFKAVFRRIFPLWFGFLLLMLALMLWSERYPILREHEAMRNFYSRAFLVLGSAAISQVILHFYADNGNAHLEAQPVHRGFRVIVCLLLLLPALAGMTHLPVIGNGLFDNSPPQTHAAKLTGKRTAGLVRTRYYFIFRDWQAPSQTLNLSVPRDFYERKSLGDTLHITTHKGTMGYEWVVDYQ